MVVTDRDDKMRSDVLWDFIDRDKMNRYVRSSDKIEMERAFLSEFIKRFKHPIGKLTSVIRQTRTGLYFNLYERERQIGHASFHYDEGRPGSISHVSDDCYDVRDDLEIAREESRSLKFKLRGYVRDVYGFLSSITSGLTMSFNGLLKRRPDIEKD